MRPSRSRRAITSYTEEDSEPDADQAWAEDAAEAAAAGSRRSQDAGWAGTAHGSSYAQFGAAGPSGQAATDAAAASVDGGSDVRLEEWEEEQLLALMSPESQKRERRRIANRDCARRIRQRKTELLAELTATVEELQADSSRILATLTEVTRCWRDTCIENAELRAQIVLAQAGASGGSRSSGGTGLDSGFPSPVGLAAQLGSPGWPSPMVL